MIIFGPLMIYACYRRKARIQEIKFQENQPNSDSQMTAATIMTRVRVVMSPLPLSRRIGSGSGGSENSES